MDATFRARFRVLALTTAGLIGVVGCASADSGVEAETSSATPTGMVTQSPSSPSQLQPVEPQLKEALADVMDRYEVPGASVMITTPDDIWSAQQGTASFDPEQRITGDMSWPLRSVTKSVVVTVLLQLVDEGELSLDDTIDTYVDGVPNGEQITLRRLADMSSGVGDYTHSEAFVDTLTADPSQQFTLEELNDYGLAEGSQFEPGTDHVYSNTATNLLGVVIEEVTGQSIAKVIDERIIEELDLAHTVYAESDKDWAKPHPQGYQPGEGQAEPIFNNFSSMGASGAMVSTPEDMTVWAKALATGELISPELHEERLVGAPLSEGPEYDEYALGIGSLEGWWGHTGEGLGFSSLVMYDQESDTSIVIFMNLSDAVAASDEGSETPVHVPTVLMREYAGILAGEGPSLTDEGTPQPEGGSGSPESTESFVH